MSSSWKLTKKLRETHLSPSFLRGLSQSPQNPPASHSGSQDSEGSRANTLVASQPPNLDQSNSHGNGAGAESSTRSTSSTVTAAKAHKRQTSRAVNPSLLRVKIYEIEGLHVPSDIRELLPPWTQGPKSSSTRPPPLYMVLEYDKTQILLHAIGGTMETPVWDKTSAFDVSAVEPPLSISVYVRVKESKSRSQSFKDNFLGGDKSDQPKVYDVLLGTAKIPTGGGIKENVALSSGGKLRIKLEPQNTKNEPLSIDDFTLLKVVGKGSFGKVMQVRKSDTRQVYALKTIRKAHIVSRSEVGHTLAERTVLAKINNPFIVPLKFSFQSPEKLYLVLAFVNGGELFHHLQREGRFDLNRSRFYTAELLCALECLHEYNVIYRDLKPENILLDYTGHIALCDFGLCKLNMGTEERTNTFCGTPEYLAPELLLGKGYTKVVDWWTLGVLFYEMLTGLPPFYDQDTNTMYHKIVQDTLTFPSDMDPEARSLLTGLLERDPKKRLGVNGASEIKSHPFFAQIDWKYLLNKKYAAPFLPNVASATDTSNFDQEFTSEVPMDSVVGKDFFLSESVQQQFGGWSYTNDSKLASSGQW